MIPIFSVHCLPRKNCAKISFLRQMIAKSMWKKSTKWICQWSNCERWMKTCWSQSSWNLKPGALYANLLKRDFLGWYLYSSVYSFFPYSSFLLHIPDYGFKCRSCDYLTVQKNNARRHVLAKHLKSNPLTCPLCQRVFYTTNTRQVHVKEAHQMNLSLKQLRKMDEDMLKPQ